MRQRRIVSVWLTRWPLERLVRTPDGPPPEPAVAARTIGQRREVVCVSKDAATAGLRAGSTVALAQASVPGLSVVEADEAADAAALHRLTLWALRYTPLAMVDTGVGPPDGLVMDITGASHLMGGEAALLSDLLSRLGRAGLAARAAVSDSQASAWALARFGPSSEDGFVGAPSRAMAETGGLPIAALRLPDDAENALRRLGFDRIGDVMAAPRKALSLRFGPDIVTRLAQLRGDAFEALDPVLPPDKPHARLAFAEPIGHTAGVEGALARLTDDLSATMTARGIGARILDLFCHRVDGEVFALRVRCAAPSRAPDHLVRLFRERLDTIDPGFGIERMVLIAPRTETVAACQLGGDDAGKPDLAPLIDKIAARVGSRRVYRIEPTTSDWPERSCRRVPALAPPVDIAWDRLPRPAVLIEPPAPARVLALLPDHPPARFAWRGGEHRVVRADGPECVFGEWWRADEEVALTRDYYRVEDEAGGRYWLFRARDEAKGTADWFVHGAFA